MLLGGGCCVGVGQDFQFTVKKNVIYGFGDFWKGFKAYPLSLECSFKLISLLDLMPELVELVSISPLGHVLLLKMVEIVVVSDNHGFVRIRHR